MREIWGLTSHGLAVHVLAGLVELLVPSLLLIQLASLFLAHPRLKHLPLLPKVHLLFQTLALQEHVVSEFDDVLRVDILCHCLRYVPFQSGCRHAFECMLKIRGLYI